MASAAEQLAANFNFSSLGKATELKKRIWFTLGVLIVYRLGTYIPLPGVDSVVLEQVFAQQQGGILGMFDMFSGGALGRMSIFALNIMPYISASIIMQLMMAMSPKLGQLKKEGDAGRKKINQYTRYGTVILAALQGYGIATFLESMELADGQAAVGDPGLFFRATIVVTIIGGTMFLMWLGEQITARGIGNGISLIIFSGIVAAFPGSVAALLEMGYTNEISPLIVVVMLVLAIAVISFIVFMERAQRRLVVQYPKRQVGQKMFGGERSHLPLKLNTSGVIPAIFASSILLLPTTMLSFSGGEGQTGFLGDLSIYLGHGQPLYLLFYAVLIIFFCFFYTSIVFNPDETADNLRRYGGYIPGFKPGKNTARYLDYVLTRLTVVGAAYLTLVALLPEILIAQYSVPFQFGGTSLLIVVVVSLDTVGQIHSHLLAHQYEGLVKKSKLRGRRG